MIVPLNEALAKINIPTAKSRTATTIKEIEEIENFPIVLKLISPKAIHKTESKGVVVAHTKEEAVSSGKELLKRGKVLVQEHISGSEFFLGIKKDETFGPVLLAGIGGIYVELYHDISFRVCPINSQDAREMLSELKGKKLLEGFRGKLVNKSALVLAMVELSKLPSKLPELVELDINPFIVNEKEGKAVDARMVIK